MEIEWKRVNPVCMIVLDGFGVTLSRKGNAILNANTPVLNRFWNEYPHLLLKASGESVGLPWGEYGNSEVGHLTLGLGNVVKQSLALIKDSIADGSFFQNAKMLEAVRVAKSKGKRLHIAGIFSTAGVHGHLDYFKAILKMCSDEGFSDVCLHLFADGRDVPPKSFNKFYKLLKEAIAEYGVGKVASVGGRFYAMDRISRWDRTVMTYQAMTGTTTQSAASVEEAIDNSYKQQIFDESIVPVMITDRNGKPVGAVQSGDSLIFINHRRDRIRQIASFFASEEEAIVEERGGKAIQNMYIVSMVFYELVNLGVKVAFSPEEINQAGGEPSSLPQLLSQNGVKQYHIAETEKFPHVTYFFNGGSKILFEGESHKLIPSKKVDGYENKPEMSLPEICQDLTKAIRSDQFGFMLTNFANPDMVGHSGNYEAGLKAVESVDTCLGVIIDEVLKKNGSVVITADHGNCEEMLNPISGNVSKEHSSNPVPFMLIDDRFKFDRRQKQKLDDAGMLQPSGLLSDVAPTILNLFDIKPAGDMSGVSLIDALV